MAVAPAISHGDVETPAIPVDGAARAAAHALDDNFDALLDALVGGQVYRCRVLPTPPRQPGVYLFAAGPNVMHVGRTRNLQARRRDQTSPSGDRFVATFPFLLARHRAAEVHDDLPTARDALAADARFVPFFIDAKADVRGMDFRCVVIEDAATQALFEIFASVALRSPYNFWETH